MASLVSPELLLVSSLNSVDMDSAASLRKGTLKQAVVAETLNLLHDSFPTVAILAIYLFPANLPYWNHAR